MLADGAISHRPILGEYSSYLLDQMIAVVETGLLGLETGQTSLAVRPGKTAELSVSIRCGKGLTGPVKVELLVPKHIKGVSAKPLSLGSSATRGALTITFAARTGPTVISLS